MTTIIMLNEIVGLIKKAKKSRKSVKCHDQIFMRTRIKFDIHLQENLSTNSPYFICCYLRYKKSSFCVYARMRIIARRQREDCKDHA